MTAITAVWVGNVLLKTIPQIVWRYTRSWLLVDLLAMAIDITLLIVQQLGPLRAIRLLRLARLSKVRLVLHAVEDTWAAQGKVGRICTLTITQSVAVILLTTHFSSCAMFFTGEQYRAFLLPNWG